MAMTNLVITYTDGGKVTFYDGTHVGEYEFTWRDVQIIPTTNEIKTISYPGYNSVLTKNYGTRDGKMTVQFMLFAKNDNKVIENLTGALESLNQSIFKVTWQGLEWNRCRILDAQQDMRPHDWTAPNGNSGSIVTGILQIQLLETAELQ